MTLHTDTTTDFHRISVLIRGILVDKVYEGNNIIGAVIGVIIIVIKNYFILNSIIFKFFVSDFKCFFYIGRF